MRLSWLFPVHWTISTFQIIANEEEKKSVFECASVSCGHHKYFLIYYFKFTNFSSSCVKIRLKRYDAIVHKKEFLFCLIKIWNYHMLLLTMRRVRDNHFPETPQMFWRHSTVFCLHYPNIIQSELCSFSHFMKQVEWGILIRRGCIVQSHK